MNLDLSGFNFNLEILIILIHLYFDCHIIIPYCYSGIIHRSCEVLFTCHRDKVVSYCLVLIVM